jgi:hypothetical protein
MRTAILQRNKKKRLLVYIKMNNHISNPKPADYNFKAHEFTDIYSGLIQGWKLSLAQQ